MPQDQLRDKSNAQEQSAQLRLGKYRIRLPRSRVARVALGLALLAGGMLFFLPVLGLWMLPPGVARGRRRAVVAPPAGDLVGAPQESDNRT